MFREQQGDRRDRHKTEGSTFKERNKRISPQDVGGIVKSGEQLKSRQTSGKHQANSRQTLSFPNRTIYRETKVLLESNWGTNLTFGSSKRVPHQPPPARHLFSLFSLSDNSKVGLTGDEIFILVN